MKLNLLVSTSQINSIQGRELGTGTIECLRHLATIMRKCGIKGDIYDLPNGSRNNNIASPFSINSGFALTTDELNIFNIPELNHNQRLKNNVTEIVSENRKLFQKNRTVSYTLKRSVMPWILKECYHTYLERADVGRIEQVEKFEDLAKYWLEDHALFSAYEELGIDLEQEEFKLKESSKSKTFKEKNSRSINFYKYIQFLCFEQRLKLHNDLKELGVGLILNLPFGVEFSSADVYFHPDVFITDFQVGCSPEPEHGYPEQAWGVAVYRERTEALKKYLQAKMRWLARFGDGVFLDHLVGWCGQYVVPMVIPPESQYPHGHFLTEDQQERQENLLWFLEIIHETGMQIRGEVAGDGNRVKASNEAIKEFLGRGNDISAMAIPRWESLDNLLIPLKDYGKNTLMMVETHDTSTQLQYLLNQKGYFEDFEAEERILEYSRRVLGLPLFASDIPLTLRDTTPGFWREIVRRLCQGVDCENIVFTLPGLISILSDEFRSPSIENNINVKPGTPGTVGNGWRNWSYYSPPIETMITDESLKKELSILGKRVFLPFDRVHELFVSQTEETDLEVIYSKPRNKKPVFASNGKWFVLNDSNETLMEKAELELCLKNNGEKEIWHRIDISELLDLERHRKLQFQDLSGNRECYQYFSTDIKNDLFFIKLDVGQVHHFLIYENDEPIEISY